MIDIFLVFKCKHFELTSFIVCFHDYSISFIYEILSQYHAVYHFVNLRTIWLQKGQIDLLLLNE